MKPFRKNIFIVIGIGILLVGGIVLLSKSHIEQAHEHTGGDIYYCPMHPNYTSNKPGICPICQMKLVKREVSGSETSSQKTSSKKIIYWTDPMIPGYKSDKPGKSPMNMDLVPVYEQEKNEAVGGASVEGHASVSLSASKQQLMGVKTEKVTARRLTKTIRAVGSVAHDTELYQTQAEYLQAAAALNKAEFSNIPEVVEQAKEMVEAVRLRLIHMGFNDGLIEELAQKKEVDHSLLFAGTGSIWVYAYIYQYELPYIDVGTTVKVEVPSFTQETFEGIVRGVHPVVHEMTRTVSVLIQIKDAKGVLKPGMYVNVRMDVDLGEVLAVPQEAVFHTGTEDVVFVNEGKGLFQPREVTLGSETDEFYEIKSGVKKDEIVVISGNFLMDSESRLKAGIEGMSDSGGQTYGQQ